MIVIRAGREAVDEDPHFLLPYCIGFQERFRHSIGTHLQTLGYRGRGQEFAQLLGKHHAGKVPVGRRGVRYRGAEGTPRIRQQLSCDLGTAVRAYSGEGGFERREGSNRFVDIPIDGLALALREAVFRCVRDESKLVESDEGAYRIAKRRHGELRVGHRAQKVPYQLVNFLVL